MSFRSFVVFLFFIFLVASYYLGFTPPLVSLLILLLSFFNFLFYAKDKKAAREGMWRTPESTLQFIALLGGWPGALIAQQKIRHKTKKRSFQLVFWAAVLSNLGFLGWLHMDQGALYLRRGMNHIEMTTTQYFETNPLMSVVKFLTENRKRKYF